MRIKLRTFKLVSNIPAGLSAGISSFVFNKTMMLFKVTQKGTYGDFVFENIYNFDLSFPLVELLNKYNSEKILSLEELFRTRKRVLSRFLLNRYYEDYPNRK